MTPPDSMAAGTAGNQTHICLIDMPAPWFQQLVHELCRGERLNLFRSCRAMRDMMLSFCTLHLNFGLPIHPDAAAAARAKLVLACKRSSRIKLRFSAVWPMPEQLTAADVNASAAQLMSNLHPLPRPAAQSRLVAADLVWSSVNSVKLEDLPLDALVPPWLTSTCPHMTSLRLHHCDISRLPPATAAIPTCSQLKELELSCSTLPGDQSDREQWQHQFRALTGLSSLILYGAHDPSEDFDPLPLLICSPVGTQLTNLSFDATMCLSEVQHFPSTFPHLNVLCLPYCTVDDEGMEMLLRLQRLRYFQCQAFSLQHSYSRRSCSWVHLDILLLHAASFERLPLAGVASLSWGGPLYIHPCDDLGAINRVAAAIAERSGTEGTDSHVVLEGAGAGSARLVANLPLAASCSPRSFTVRAAPFTLELLAAIKQHLPSVRYLELYKCSLAEGVLPVLLPSLSPGVQELVVEFCPGLDEAALAAVCVLAGQQISINVWSEDEARWQEGWEQRVQAAMAAAGHQHVTLEYHHISRRV